MVIVIRGLGGLDLGEGGRVRTTMHHEAEARYAGVYDIGMVLDCKPYGDTGSVDIACGGRWLFSLLKEV